MARNCHSRVNRGGFRKRKHIQVNELRLQAWNFRFQQRQTALERGRKNLFVDAEALRCPQSQFSCKHELLVHGRLLAKCLKALQRKQASWQRLVSRHRASCPSHWSPSSCSVQLKGVGVSCSAGVEGTRTFQAPQRNE